MEIALNIAPIALAIIMLGLGLGLTVNDFSRVIKKPKDFIVGFALQVILLPIVAFFLIKILNTPLELAMGVMIIAAAPGGVTSNVLTKYVNGDVALSISLTATISLLSIFSVPFIIYKSAELLNFSDFSNNISMIVISFKMFMNHSKNVKNKNFGIMHSTFNAKTIVEGESSNAGSQTFAQSRQSKEFIINYFQL